MSGPLRHWRTLAASVRGSVHVTKSIPNEDAVATRELAGMSIVAVADGHGSEQSSRSDVGSHLAVRVALDAAADHITGIDPRRADADAFVKEAVGVRIVDGWRVAVAEHLTRHPLNAEELASLGDAPAEYAYGTTVLLAGCGSGVGFAVQLGDGHILLIDDDGTGSLAFPDDKLVATETNSLCMVDAHRFLRARVWPLDGQHPKIIAVSTDGWGDAFEDRGWFDRVGRQLTEELQSGGIGRIDEQLEGWLGRTAEGFGDDTTMALLIETDEIGGSESITSVADQADTGPIGGSMAGDLEPSDSPNVPRTRRRRRVAGSTWFIVITVAIVALAAGVIAGRLLRADPALAAPRLWTSVGLVTVDGDQATLSTELPTGVSGSGPDTVIDGEIVWQIDGASLLRIDAAGVQTTVPVGALTASWSAVAIDGRRLLLAESNGWFVLVIDTGSCESGRCDTILCIDVQRQGATRRDLEAGCPADISSNVPATTDTTVATTTRSTERGSVTITVAVATTEPRADTQTRRTLVETTVPTNQTPNAPRSDSTSGG